MSDTRRPYGQPDPEHDRGAVPPQDPAYPPAVPPPAYDTRPIVVPSPAYEQRPGTVPTGEPADAWDAPVPAPGENLRLNAGRFWAGAAATVLVCALIGFAASVIIEQVFDLELLSPPDLFDAGTSASWAGAGALFALLAAVVLQLLVVATPRPSMFFGWLVGLTAVILAVLPFTGDPDVLPAVLTALVWIVLGLAVWSMLTGVLSRTIVRPLPPPAR
ncbi:hypothetical protein [Isoptericola variabilis]|uniref:Uncharacterized protein n=1 Tax=Isoptericola variabilis (strain 225) TaxID=743718 RepID=F6FQK1_ISOV2|nr:hypothetical protein [Isoptericola variabilis]AEG44897.1 hypothetical protein Isova_2175 [Isoptericola variabilis 225]TWH28739.1 hypothetical protein L600_003900000190 [Isoptericola variabilis J7]